MLHLHDVRFQDLGGAGGGGDLQLVVAAAGGFLAELVGDPEAVAHEDLGGKIVGGTQG